MLCLKCQETDGELAQNQLMALLTGLPGKVTEEKPDAPWLTDVLEITQLNCGPKVMSYFEAAKIYWKILVVKGVKKECVFGCLF